MMKMMMMMMMMMISTAAAALTPRNGFCSLKDHKYMTIRKHSPSLGILWFQSIVFILNTGTPLPLTMFLSSKMWTVPFTICWCVYKPLDEWQTVKTLIRRRARRLIRVYTLLWPVSPDIYTIYGSCFDAAHMYLCREIEMTWKIILTHC